MAFLEGTESLTSKLNWIIGNNMVQQAELRAMRMLVKLSAYVAAGGSLAASDAAAAVIHTDLGPGGVTVANGNFALDVNHDTVIDFSISHHFSDRNRSCTTFTSGTIDCQQDGFLRFVEIQANGANLVMGYGYPVASNLEQGSLIRPQDFLSAPTRAMLRFDSFFRSCDSTTCTSRWSNTGNFGRGMLGLRFADADGETHFGWAEVAVIDSGFQVFGFAYETEADTSITAGAVPEPPALVLLAAGAIGVMSLRKRRAFQRSN